MVEVAATLCRIVPMPGGEKDYRHEDENGGDGQRGGPEEPLEGGRRIQGSATQLHKPTLSIGV